MSPTNDVDEGEQHDPDISRWTFPRLPGGWLWVVVLLLLACVLYITFFIPARAERNDGPPREFDPTFFSIDSGLILVGLLGVIALIWWLQNRWLLTAKRPGKYLARGDVARADRAYDTAIAYARSYGADDRRRGIMLLELTNFLAARGRFAEKRVLLDEAVAILENNQAKDRLTYFIALNNLAVFLLNQRAFAAAQETLEKALDLAPSMKKANVQSPDLECMLHLNLAVLLVKTNHLEQAKTQLDEAEKLSGSLLRSNREPIRQMLLAQRCLWLCAAGQPDAPETDAALTLDTEDPYFLLVQAKVLLDRREFVRAEQILHKVNAVWTAQGTAHRPDNLEGALDLAECLFAQARHDDALAALQEARAIVVDFDLPADDVWRRALTTWLKRVRDLGNADLATTLAADLQKIPAASDQAITIVDKLRVGPQTEYA